MRVFAVSDLHVNYDENKEWCKSISDVDFQDDVILLAGDLSHLAQDVEDVLKVFKQKFKEVFFVPGNHDVWLWRHEKEQFTDSIHKFNHLMEICESLGVHTKPKILDDSDVCIVPLLSWYEEEMDDYPDSNQAPTKLTWSDFYHCSWPSWPSKDTRSTTKYFLEKNTPAIEWVLQEEHRRKKEGIKEMYVITFSHFLPRKEVLPARNFLIVDFLPKVMGTKKLDEQLRAIGSKVHVFGHSHINWNEVIDGVHYVQRALRYPHERKKWYSTQNINEMMIYDSDSTQPNLHGFLFAHR